jgi:protein-tyrosine sulfotransferase
MMNLLDRIIKKITTSSSGPQVRERVVVKTVERGTRESLPPGFIIGVYRSGTTLLRYVLDSHKNIAVPPESNFLNGLAAFHDDEWYRKGLQGMGVDEDGLGRHLRSFAGDLFDDYAIAKGKRRWFDKTPSYVDILEFLNSVFGEECRYIMLYRHGLDVANSMARMYENDVNRGPGRKFAGQYPDAPHLTNLRYWVEQCEKMLAFEAANQAQCFRITYEEYSAEPEVYLPPLFEFLGEEWDPQVLEFYKQQHDYGLQDFKAEESKGFVPNTGSYKSWPEAEISQAMEIAGPTLKKLGYLP